MPSPRRKPEITVSKAERMLRCAVLGQPFYGRRIEVRIRRINEAAALVIIKEPHDKGPHTVTVDFRFKGLFPGVIHELCHVCFRKILKPLGAFEEGTVNDVMEGAIQNHIAKSAKRTQWWTDTLDRITDSED